MEEAKVDPKGEPKVEKERAEARRWLSRQLAWESTLDQLVKTWEKEQGVVEAKPPRKARRRPRTSGLPLENPAA